MTTFGSRRRGALVALHLLAMAALIAPAPALAMQVLDAADHAELAAEISATNVNRIALAGDRIAKVVRSPDGFAVEHDAASGDLYLRPAARRVDIPASAAGQHAPVTLFIGTEKGFTYRLTLRPSARDSAQILIRNADTARSIEPVGPGAAGDPRIGVRGGPHVAALVRLVRAVARREALPGHEILASGMVSRFRKQPAPDTDAGGRRTPIRTGPFGAGIRIIETWRGPRFRALVLEADSLPSASGHGGAWPGPGSGPAGLAGTIGELPGAGRVVALWLAAPGTGPSGRRLAVAVVEAPAGEPR